MAALQRDFSPADLKREMSRCGVDRTIAVQARQTLEETRWLLDLAERSSIHCRRRRLGRSPVAGGRRGAGGDLGPPETPGRPARRAVGGARISIVRGVSPRARAARAVRPDVRHAGLRPQLPEVVDFVRAFPSQRFVLDHLGKPDIKGGGHQAWRPHFEELASFPHVWCKLSGLVTEADWRTWTAEQLRPYIETALECFGPERLMIGSDWPVCTLASPYTRTLAVVEDALGGCSSKERASILGGTAQHLWNL